MDLMNFAQKKKKPSADLLASVLCRFLVSLSLLSSVQGILLVELEHLHLLLDGVHGCLLSVLHQQNVQIGGKKESKEGAGQRLGRLLLTGH